MDRIDSCISCIGKVNVTLVRIANSDVSLHGFAPRQAEMLSKFTLYVMLQKDALSQYGFARLSSMPALFCLDKS